MNHRWTAIALSLVAVCFLSACGSFQQALEPTPVLTPTVTPTSEPPPTPTPTPTSSVTPLPTPTPGADSYQSGFWSDTGYYSKFFGFGIKPTLGWISYDQATLITKINGFAIDPTDRNAFDQASIEALKQGNVVFDFYAFQPETEDVLILLVADMAASGELQLSELNALEYYQTFLFDLDGDWKTDVTDVQMAVIDLFGEEHPVFKYRVDFAGKNTFGMVFAIKQGTIFAIVNLTSVDESKLDDVLKTFYALP